MNLESIDLPNEEATKAEAQALAQVLIPGMVLTFSGEIGSGKTSFIRAMLRFLGVKAAIKSPTFSIVESYTCPNFIFNHFDLYRIQEEEELAYIGFRDYFSSHAVCCVEWPERAPNSLPRAHVQCHLSMKGQGRLLLIETIDLQKIKQ